MNHDEFYSRDYNVDEIEMDHRFVRCEKEMKIVIGIQLLFTIVTIGVAYYFGSGDPNEYTYILGLPAWWFLVILTTLVFMGIAVYITKFVLKDMSLDDEL